MSGRGASGTLWATVAAPEEAAWKSRALQVTKSKRERTHSQNLKLEAADGSLLSSQQGRPTERGDGVSPNVPMLQLQVGCLYQQTHFMDGKGRVEK